MYCSLLLFSFLMLLFTFFLDQFIFIYIYFVLYNLVRHIHTHTTTKKNKSSFYQIYFYNCLQTWRTRFRLDVTFISQKGNKNKIQTNEQFKWGENRNGSLLPLWKKTNYNSTEILQLKSTEVSTIVISKHSH